MTDNNNDNNKIYKNQNETTTNNLAIEFTSNSLGYITKELENEILLGYINNIQNIDFNTIKLKIHRKETKQLIINSKFLYIPSLNIEAMEKSTAFIKFLKKKLDNQRIHEIKQYKNNKLIYFKLDSYYLIFELFSNSNVVLTDLEFKVISARRYERWKDRNIIRNELYGFPESNYFLDTTKEEFIKENIGKTKKGFISENVRKYNIAPIYLNNIFDENKLYDDLNKENLDLIYTQLNELFIIDNQNLKIIKTKNKKIIIIEKTEDENKINFSDLEKIVVNNKIMKDNSPTTKKIKKIENIVDIQLQSKATFLENVEKYKQQGESIYCNFMIIDEINKQIDIATTKKIDSKEICLKINYYFKTKNLDLNIKNIDLKNKTYILKTN
jgi:predicted ribosome quality control (RQC) complex YloA/Tae2 family protein